MKQPAPFLQMAAVITSVVLGGSYVLYRGGVLSLPLVSSAQAGEPKQANPPATPPEAITTPLTNAQLMMTSSKSGAVGLNPTIVSGPLHLDGQVGTLTTLPPPAAPDHIVVGPGRDASSVTISKKPAPVAPERQLMLGSKSGAISFPPPSAPPPVALGSKPPQISLGAQPVEAIPNAAPNPRAIPNQSGPVAPPSNKALDLRVQPNDPPQILATPGGFKQAR